jgi:branched-chain amino acid transport system permease protein
MSVNESESNTSAGPGVLWRPDGLFWRWAGGLFIAIFGVSPLLDPYTVGLLVQAYIFATLALTVDVVWGYTGVLTFASAAMFGIGAYAVGIVFVHTSLGAGAIPVALVMAVVVACALSALIGWLAFYSRVKVSEFYIAVVTLGLSVLFNQTVSYGGPLTGGSNGLSGFATVPMSSPGWYVISGLALLCAMLVALRLVRSDFGLILRSIRDHEMRCRYLGIRTPLIKTVVFTACNGVAAAVGVLYALYTTVVAPSLVGFVLATNVLIWVMLGGRGTLLGPVLAAILVNVITPELSTTIPLYWQGTLGILFVIVVVGLPRGLLPGVWDGITWLVRTGRARITGAARVASRGAAVGGAIPARPDLVEPPLYAIAQEGSEPAPATPTPQAGNGAVLEIEHVSKNFGSFQALTDVSLRVRRGELVSIVGPNGAGKTSLVRCISDGHERSAGSITIDGHSVGHRPPDDIVMLGLGRKFQGASVFDSLTVGECLRLASWKGRLPSIWRRQPTVRLPAPAVDVVQGLGLSDVWYLPARDISHGQRQALELAMVLALEPSVLVLDEPTAGLTSAERGAVGRLLSQLVSTGRLAIVLIEHDFDFVKEISTRIVVLHEGKVLADGTVEDVADSKLVKDIYLGRSQARAAR